MATIFSEDFREFIQALNDKNVEYILVGGTQAYHLGLIKYKAVPSGSIKCINSPPSSILFVALMDNFCNKDFASSKSSMVNPIDVLPEFSFKLLCLVGCSPIMISGALSWA